MSKKHTSLRPLQFRKSYYSHAEGSCMVRMGRTQVLCVATVENGVPSHAEEKGIGWIHAEYSMLPRSGEKRSSRMRAVKGGRSQEISRLIGRSLRAAVDLEALGSKSIIIDCDVIRADGGTRTASINGGMVALVQALMILRKKGDLVRWPIKSFVGAVSVGTVHNRLVLDMDYAHDKEAGTDMNLVMTSEGKVVEIQGTAEGKPLSIQHMNRMVQLSKRAINQIIRKQKKVCGRLPS